MEFVKFQQYPTPNKRYRLRCLRLPNRRTIVPSSPIRFQPRTNAGNPHQMLEQLVAGPFPLPPSNQEVALAPPQTPSNPVLAPEQHPTRFDMSQSDRIKQLQDELRELRAKATTQEIELARVQVDSAVQIANAIQSIREQTLGENQRLQAELDEANRRLEQMNVLGSPQPIFEEFPDDLSDVSTGNQTPISMSVDSSPVSSAFMYPDTPPPLYSPPHSSPADAPHRHQLNVRRRLFPKDHPDDDDEPPTRCRRLESLQTPVRTQDPHTFSPSSLSGQTPVGPPGRELVWVYPPVFPPPYQTPTPPPRTPTPLVPAYESPKPIGQDPNREPVWLREPTGNLHTLPDYDTEYKVGRAQKVRNQIRVEQERVIEERRLEQERTNRRPDRIQWNGDAGPQVAQNDILAYFCLPQKVLQHLDELYTANQNKLLSSLELIAFDKLMQQASITEQRRRGGDNIVTDIVRLFHDVTELIHRVYRRLQHFEDVGNGPQAHIKIMPLDPLRRIILEPQLFSKPITGAVRQIRAPQRPWPPLYRRRPLAYASSTNTTTGVTSQSNTITSDSCPSNPTTGVTSPSNTTTSDSCPPNPTTGVTCPSNSSTSNHRFVSAAANTSFTNSQPTKPTNCTERTSAPTSPVCTSG